MPDQIPQESAPKLQNLPAQLWPREKLINKGRKTLTDAELLAIFLRMGIPGKNVLQLSEELLRTAGSLHELASMEAVEIEALCPKGIGKAKAAALTAAFELGCRAIQEQLTTEPFDTPDKIYDYLASTMLGNIKETVQLLLLDAKCCLIKRVNISIGTINEVIAHPRDVLRPAIIHNAYGFIMGHNHPSGNPAPSKADDKMTERIKTAADIVGVRFLDHLIIGTPTRLIQRNYFSYMHTKPGGNVFNSTQTEISPSESVYGPLPCAAEQAYDDLRTQAGF